VLGAIKVPLVIWGVANHEKDEAVFKQIAQDCQDVQLTLGPVEDKNHKGIGAAAMVIGTEDDAGFGNVDSGEGLSGHRPGVDIAGVRNDQCLGCAGG